MRNSSQSQRRKTLAYQCLESRHLLASVSFEDGTLTIIGSNQNDQIQIVGTESGTLSVQDDGITEWTGNVSDIATLNVWSLDGDDQVSFTGTLTDAAFESIGFFLGDGDDQLSLETEGLNEDATLQAVGGLGDDRLDAGQMSRLTPVQFFGGRGSDTLVGGIGNDRLAGQAGDDLIEGGRGDDRISGGDGNDDIDGGTGDDHIDGGHGNDELHGGQSISLNESGSQIEVGGHDWISGGRGSDKIYGGDGDDYILAGQGTDHVWGESGFDTIFGGEDNDFLYGGTGNDKLYGGDFNDHCFGGLGDDLVNGGRGHDQLAGNEGDDILVGGDGNDQLRGFQGNDKLLGQSGNDELFGQYGTNQILGGDGDDLLMGSQTARDILIGGDGNDWMGNSLEDWTDFNTREDRRNFGMKDLLGMTQQDAIQLIETTHYSHSIYVFVDRIGELLVENQSGTVAGEIERPIQLADTSGIDWTTISPIPTGCVTGFAQWLDNPVHIRLWIKDEIVVGVSNGDLKRIGRTDPCARIFY